MYDSHTIDFRVDKKTDRALRTENEQGSPNDTNGLWVWPNPVVISLSSFGFIVRVVVGKKSLPRYVIMSKRLGKNHKSRRFKSIGYRRGASFFLTDGKNSYKIRNEINMTYKRIRACAGKI